MLNILVKDAVPAGAYHPAPMESMGDRIRSLRVARGLNQTQLADLCGVTKSAVSQWENGLTANVKLAAFMKLVDALHTDPAYLIWGKDRGPGGSESVTGRHRRPPGLGGR